MEGDAPKQEFEQKPIRTYESDIAEAIGQKKTSQASIAMAEIERTRAQQLQVPTAGQQQQIADKEAAEKAPYGKNILKIILSLILLCAGVMGCYYLYTISPLAAQRNAPAIQAPAALLLAIITPDSQKTIDVTAENSKAILAQISNLSATNVPLSTILEIVFGENASSTTGKAAFMRVTGPEFVPKIGLNPPDMFLQSLTAQWMFGFYGSASGPSPFIILTTNFFQNAFAGILQWESTMPNDIAPLLGINVTPPTIPAASMPVFSTSTIATSTATTTKNTKNKNIATTTATSTNKITTTNTITNYPPASFFAISGQFVDKVIQNKDVREFRDQNGNILFLYAFIDNNTIAIARTEATLGEIITRFEKRAYVR